MGHTPGPWTLHRWGDNDYEINAAEWTVCYVPGFVDDTVESDMAEHNAPLIAAAPELLDGLKATVESLVELAQYEEAAQDMVATGWFDQAVKAIAKAEGRSG